MSETITIARPYAKAIFEHALHQGKLTEWSTILFAASQIALNDHVISFIGNPAATIEQQITLMADPLKKMADTGEIPALDNFIRTLAENKRLQILPDIYVLFEAMRSEQEKTLTISVTSYSTLSNTQEKELIDALSKRLQRQVTLKVAIDKSLLGGAIIKAGDLVIDGSVRGKLNKLGAGLAA
ncbi:F0F1 ATP synthase subunit delta [Legionella sp. MW5194]|uniref:F0F1 ATP synthase subunit delta n=1 Tax=Legionella sp. MW5194 TaxID=2662448 RepID=UPI00193CA7A3|nr:F0F1 ATP synthase subunit delta [Legionella sp. MW5194]QRN04980.1 F0F1 ATP synthase subunit delta [Legionella sp. MW5194]